MDDKKLLGFRVGPMTVSVDHKQPAEIDGFNQEDHGQFSFTPTGPIAEIRSDILGQVRTSAEMHEVVEAWNWIHGLKLNHTVITVLGNCLHEFLESAKWEDK